MFYRVVQSRILDNIFIYLCKSTSTRDGNILNPFLAQNSITMNFWLYFRGKNLEDKRKEKERSSKGECQNCLTL